MDSLREQFNNLRLSQGISVRGTVRSTDDPFIVKLIQLLFTHGVKTQASDIHIEPTRSGARIRYRIDGILHELLQVAEEVREPLIRSIKTKASLATDALGRSKPQDGRIDFEVDGKTLDMRLSSFPTVYGDVVAIRILDRAATRLKLEELGFPPDLLKQFNQTISRPNGFVLVSGPTNSGKTTTLYAALEKLCSPHVKIVTLEDPVEYQMEGVDQAQINPHVGFSFASGLRAILRQDANIILVGEMRDKETVEISVRAALTGHLVFSTIHTRHACGAITRLLDMGIEPHLIAASVSGVLAMRLVRLVCHFCSAPNPLAKKSFDQLLAQTAPPGLNVGQMASSSASPANFLIGKGCDQCNMTGYKGRTGLFEFLLLNDELKSCILERSSSKLYSVAVANGMRTMLVDGLDKVAQGLTTIEEVLRVIGESEEA